MPVLRLLVACLIAVVAWPVSAVELPPVASDPVGRDPRNLRHGLPIPDEGYCDQPYVVVTPQGHWVCTMTTGPGREGEQGQHVVATISTDQGQNWSDLIDIEPSSGPEASWIVPLITPTGRIYGFYTYNGDNIRTLDGRPIRADTIGWYAMKFSDDGGRTWSPQRYRLPLRTTACDRSNDFHGDVQMFWGIDKPNIVGTDALFAFTKLGKYMLERGEGWVFRSDNLLSETDPDRIRWELLPDGEHGIQHATFGSIQEEHNLVPIGDRDLYCVYRTTKGFPCQSYSRDGGISSSAISRVR
ncbi:MAG: glycoside hydrolase [Planctomycetes bacterium]|nr:glycoside hydrolase [Planctomycetota bacterium]